MKHDANKHPSNGLIEFARKYGWEFSGMSFGRVYNFKNDDNMGISEEKPSDVRRIILWLEEQKQAKKGA